MTPAVLRTCIGCRRVRPKSELVRLIRRGDGRVDVDRSGTASGRGGYVCPGRGCVGLVLKRGRLAHAFRGRAEASEELLAWVHALGETDD
ncbi:MAG: YlxR family protein [Candidatus Methylomirabilia bacterium]